MKKIKAWWKNLGAGDKNCLKGFIVILTITILFHLFVAKVNNSSIFCDRILGITVLVATLQALLIYTWKTWQLKDLTAEQISLSIRPVVIFEADHIKVKNIGKSIAANINIEIKEIRLTDNRALILKRSSKDVQGKITFLLLSYLDNIRSSEILDYQIRLNGQMIKNNDTDLSIEKIFSLLSDIRSNFDHLRIIISYSDIRNSRYHTTMEFSDNRWNFNTN